MPRPRSQVRGFCFFLFWGTVGAKVHCSVNKFLSAEVGRGLSSSPGMGTEGPWPKAPRDTAMSEVRFICASRRAQLWGHSLCRGRRMSDKTLQSARLLTSTSTSSYIISQIRGQPSSRASRQQYHATCHAFGKRSGQRHRHQLRISSWNCGGMSSVQYDDLLAHLSCNNVDLACLQETRWTMNQKWQAHPLGHRSREDKVNGLLLVIRRSLLDACEPNVSEIIPGCLAHYRLVLRGGVHLHLLNVYQDASQKKDKQESRQKFWHLLNAQLNCVPKRGMQYLTLCCSR